MDGLRVDGLIISTFLRNAGTLAVLSLIIIATIRCCALWDTLSGGTMSTALHRAHTAINKVFNGGGDDGGGDVTVSMTIPSIASLRRALILGLVAVLIVVLFVVPRGWHRHPVLDSVNRGVVQPALQAVVTALTTNNTRAFPDADRQLAAAAPGAFPSSLHRGPATVLHFASRLVTTTPRPGGGRPRL